MKKIFIVIGTRPDAIKMAPIYNTLSHTNNLSVKLVSTGQHKELLTCAMKSFNLQPDINLDVMRDAQSLSSLAADILHGLEETFRHETPDIVLCHGDTITCFSASLACFFHHVPFYHVEAGLRSHNIFSPYPEEFIRKTVSTMASHHFVPTPIEKSNLLQDGIIESNITIIGNSIHEAIEHSENVTSELPKFIKYNDFHKIVLITIHRRENGKHHLQSIIDGIKNAAIRSDKCIYIFPIHPNPVTKEICKNQLEGIKNIILLEPLEYRQFIGLIKMSNLILTDSGGVQEEAAYFKKNVFILRETIERYDGVHDGYTQIIGVQSDVIENAILHFLAKDEPKVLPILKRETSEKTPSRIIRDYILSH